jgi:hypothetical protein
MRCVYISCLPTSRHLFIQVLYRVGPLQCSELFLPFSFISGVCCLLNGLECEIITTCQLCTLFRGCGGRCAAAGVGRRLKGGCFGRESCCGCSVCGLWLCKETSG